MRKRKKGREKPRAITAETGISEEANRGCDESLGRFTCGMDSPNTLIPIIQVSTTPVILISGMGLLLLTMTNRMGRIIDRTRVYAAQLKQVAPSERAQVERQLELTWQRAKLVRFALTAATSSMLMSAGLVMLIFVEALLHENFGRFMLVLFCGAILLLIAALLAFLRDIFVSLSALRLEVEHARSQSS
jgi:hypothetical protein